MSTVLLFKLYVFKSQISTSYDLIIAAFSNFNRSIKGAAKCCGMILVTIGTQHNSKTAIWKLCARVVRVQTRALTFNIAYSMLHKISFRMSGRSSLCDLWFSQTLRHKFDLYIYLSIYLYIWILMQVPWNENFKGPYLGLWKCIWLEILTVA